MSYSDCRTELSVEEAGRLLLAHSDCSAHALNSCLRATGYKEIPVADVRFLELDAYDLGSGIHVDVLKTSAQNPDSKYLVAAFEMRDTGIYRCRIRS